jgi:hypothetical protein
MHWLERRGAKVLGAFAIAVTIALLVLAWRWLTGG